MTTQPLSRTGAFAHKSAHYPSSKGKARVLLTSLLDQRRFTPEELADCYRRRWEIETSYRELKQSMLGDAHGLAQPSSSRHQAVALGALIAYTLVRLELAKAAIKA